MRVPAKLASVANLGLRASTLGFRFLLSFYIIKYLGYGATGLFGLAVGAAGIMPALIGWGLNNLVSREIVGIGAEKAAARVKTRLLVTFASLAGATLIAWIAAILADQPITMLHVLIVVLVWFETLALDLHLPLIGLEKAVEANILVFVRSALWVPLAIALGIFYEPARSLDVVFLFWIGAHLVALALLGFFIRRLPIRRILKDPIEFRWLAEKFRRGRGIYLSDLGLVGLIYADRYVVSFFLGLAATGIYSFYWSLANALQTLVATVVVQTALPVLVKAYRAGSRADWFAVMRREGLKTAILTPILAVAIFGGSEILIHGLGMAELSQHRGLFAMMLLAAVLRTCLDLLNVGLISTGADLFYVVINIASVFISLALTALGSIALGLEGVGIASLATATLLLLIRGAALVHWVRKNPLLA